MSLPSVAATIVSNSRLWREGLVALLAEHMNLRVLGSLSGTLPWDITPPTTFGAVVLLHGAVGWESAVTWVRFWRSLEPAPMVVVVDVADDPDAIVSLIEVGAAAYVVEGASIAEVASTIKQVLKGEALCSAEVTSRLFARLTAYSARSANAAPPVTARELEVLQHLAEDRSNQEIAELLVIELHTVKRHVHNILSKLKARNRWDAAKFAIERGWVQASSSDPPGRDGIG